MSGIPTDAITDTLSRQYAANLMREAGVDEQIIAISGTPLSPSLISPGRWI